MGKMRANFILVFNFGICLAIDFKCLSNPYQCLMKKSDPYELMKKSNPYEMMKKRMFYPDEDYSEIEMYKREFLPMMDDLMKTAKFVPQTFSASDDGVTYSKRAPREGMYDAVMSQLNEDMEDE